MARQGMGWVGIMVLGLCLVIPLGCTKDQEMVSAQETTLGVSPPERPDGAPETVAAGEESAEAWRIVELAICLDTSGSMRGLLNAARERLWAITNDLALAKPTPRFRVALLTYGNDGHNAENGWVKVETGLTEDLDRVSERLFAQTTNGGTEYVGRVMQAALDQLEWTPSHEALKLIIVAGNESADQDQQVSFRDMCRRAISQSIMVNSIYCGNPTDNLAPAWREVATLADGHFASIDQNNGTVSISTPFDEELVALGTAINGTYIAYGERGAWGASNQLAQDSNAGQFGLSNSASRAATKGSSLYNNDAWDLVDASNHSVIRLEELQKEDLPEELRDLSLEELRAKIEELTAKRGELRKQITELNRKRQQYIREELEKNASLDDQAFDRAVRDAIRSQAIENGLRFEDE